jgi:hypothetical protein
MNSFHQFSVHAASRNEGLHPKLRALLERAAASPFSELSMRKDGLIQLDQIRIQRSSHHGTALRCCRESRSAPPLLRCVQARNVESRDGKSETRPYRLAT